MLGTSERSRKNQHRGRITERRRRARTSTGRSGRDKGRRDEKSRRERSEGEREVKRRIAAKERGK